MRGDKVQKVWMGFINIAALVHTDTLGRTGEVVCFERIITLSFFVLFGGAGREIGTPRGIDLLIRDYFAFHFSS